MTLLEITQLSIQSASLYTIVVTRSEMILGNTITGLHDREYDLPKKSESRSERNINYAFKFMPYQFLRINLTRPVLKFLLAQRISGKSKIAITITYQLKMKTLQNSPPLGKKGVWMGKEPLTQCFKGKFMKYWIRKHFTVLKEPSDINGNSRSPAEGVP